MTRTRLAGILFLSAFLAYGVGASIGSVPLMLLNSAIVVAIGALLYPRLTRPVGVIYLAARVWEAALLGFGTVIGGATGETLYQAGMLGLAIGSLFFCWQLLRAALVPTFLAWWGFIGYAIFAVGAALELVGVTGAGLWCSILGGLFEVFFGVWLIARGLREPTARRATRR